MKYLWQIGVKTECRSNLCRLALFYGNKTNHPFLVRLKWKGRMKFQIIKSILILELFSQRHMFSYIESSSAAPGIDRSIIHFHSFKLNETCWILKLYFHFCKQRLSKKVSRSFSVIVYIWLCPGEAGGQHSGGRGSVPADGQRGVCPGLHRAARSECQLLLQRFTHEHQVQAAHLHQQVHWADRDDERGKIFLFCWNEIIFCWLSGILLAVEELESTLSGVSEDLQSCRWNGQQWCYQVKTHRIRIPGKNQEMMKKYCYQFFPLQLLENIDPNPDNFVCAGIIHTRSLQIGTLLRLEPNKQAQVGINKFHFYNNLKTF